MVIVQVRDGDVRYALYADLTSAGDLVLTGHDVGRGPADGAGRDEYESVYTVRAMNVARVCEVLGATQGTLLDAIQHLLAPEGVRAGTAWRAWLQTHAVAYELAVR